jgi:putative endonuclease
MFFVYILEAEESKRYYIGQTENLEDRINRHNQGKNLSTKAYIPWNLKWWKEFNTRADAIKSERKLKGIKKRTGLERYVIKNKFSGCGAVG